MTLPAPSFPFLPGTTQLSLPIHHSNNDFTNVFSPLTLWITTPYQPCSFSARIQFKALFSSWAAQHCWKNYRQMLDATISTEGLSSPWGNE